MTSSDDEAAEEATPSQTTKRRRLVNTSPKGGRDSLGSNSQQDPPAEGADGDQYRYPPGAPQQQADPASLLQNARREGDGQYGVNADMGGGSGPTPPELLIIEERERQRSMGMMPEQQTNPSGGDPNYLPAAGARDNASLLSSLSSGPRASQYEQYAMGAAAPGALQYDASLLDRGAGQFNPFSGQQRPAGSYMMGAAGAAYPPSALPMGDVARMPPHAPYMDPRALQAPPYNDAAGLGGYPYGRGALPPPYVTPDPSIYSDAWMAQRYPLTAAAMSSKLGGGLGRAHMRRELLQQQGNDVLEEEEVVAQGPPNPDAILLYNEKDENALSQYQCVVRKQIELFAAEQVDTETNAQGRNKPIVLGQVGIRCLHCSTVHPRRRARAGTYYPSKLSGFYQAAQNMASGHLCQHCTLVPPMLRRQLLILRERKSSAGGGKEYWATSVQNLGVYEDHENGILRFKEKDATEENKEAKGETEEDKGAEETRVAEEDSEKEKAAAEGKQKKGEKKADDDKAEENEEKTSPEDEYAEI